MELTVSSGLVFNVLTSLAHPSKVPIVSSQPAKYTSSLPKVFLILLNVDEPQLVWTEVRLDIHLTSAAMTESAYSKVRASKCVQGQFTGIEKIRQRCHRAFCLWPVDLIFFFCNDNKTGEVVKICPRGFWPKFKATHFLFSSTRLLTAAEQAASQVRSLHRTVPPACPLTLHHWVCSFIFSAKVCESHASKLRSIFSYSSICSQHGNSLYIRAASSH